MNYDIIIIGAGPGGIFSAYELTRGEDCPRIAIFEEGHELALGLNDGHTGGTRAGGKGECFAICFLGPMRQRGVCAKRLADGDPLLFLGCAHEGAHC